MNIYTTTKEDFLKCIQGKSRKDFELLMPAGSWEKAMYAIEFGADAIYCGIPMFTLRGKSTMSMDDLARLVPYAHSRGVKVYFAVNIFPHSFKYEQFMKDMKTMVEEIKPDAFIMADPGLIDLTREHFPSAEIHLSVQQNNVNWMSGRFWRKLGVTRIVLARELTLKEVQLFHKMVPDMEIEFFIHGSNCMAYSGRCMLSNYMNYRDSNQGVCNNACRFKYKVYKSDNPDAMEPLQAEGYKEVSKGTYFVEEQLRKGELYEVSEDETGTYIFNSKDNCMAEHLAKLMEAGVCSFKVEGRTKSVYYAAIVARTYRRLFDQLLAGEDPDIDWAIRELNTTSNRGFIPGFLEGNPKENSFDYEKKTSHQTHIFAAIVRNVLSSEEGKSVLEIETRGNFKLGDTLEFITPNTEFTWKVDNLVKPVYNGEDIPLEKVAGGLDYLVKIEVPFEIKNEYCVIRRELSEEEIKKAEE
jgi:putative protease